MFTGKFKESQNIYKDNDFNLRQYYNLDVMMKTSLVTWKFILPNVQLHA